MQYDSTDLRNFLNKMTDTIIDATKTVADSAKETVDVAPLSIKLHEKENYLEKQYFELGVLYFQEHSKDEEFEFDQMKRILDIQEEIRSLNDEIALRKGKGTCPDCGEFITKSTHYCPNCGTKLD